MTEIENMLVQIGELVLTEISGVRDIAYLNN